ncbi:MAG: PAS domain S-box protein [Sulfuricellaceae bacterium]
MTGQNTVQRHPIDLIVVEDSVIDAELEADALREAGLVIDVRRVEDGSAFRAALDERLPDAILTDWTLPHFSGRGALAIARERCPDVPFIFVSGTIEENSAIEALRNGAIDYVYKHQLQKLAPALTRALDESGAKQQHRESEERFRKISESAQDAIMMMGADQRISFWNAAAERIFGYTAAEAIGQELHTLITPTAAHAKFSQAFPHFQETGEGPIIGKVRELTALRKGGEEFSVELSVSATQLNGQWHAIGIVRDITERKQAESKLAEQLDELRRWQEVMLGREMRTIEVMHEVNELLAQAGQPPRYSSVAAEGSLRSSGAAPRPPEGRVSGGVLFTGEPTGVPLAGE